MGSGHPLRSDTDLESLTSATPKPPRFSKTLKTIAGVLKQICADERAVTANLLRTSARPEKRKADDGPDALMDLIRKKKELQTLHASLDDDDSDTEAVASYREEVQRKIKKLKQSLYPAASSGSGAVEAASATQISVSASQVSATQPYDAPAVSPTQVYVATGMESRDPMWMGRISKIDADSICNMMDIVHSDGGFGRPKDFGDEGFEGETWHECTARQKKVIALCVTQNFVNAMCDTKF